MSLSGSAARASLRVQGRDPEMSGLETPMRGRRAAGESDATPAVPTASADDGQNVLNVQSVPAGGGGNGDEGGNTGVRAGAEVVPDPQAARRRQALATKLKLMEDLKRVEEKKLKLEEDWLRARLEYEDAVLQDGGDPALPAVGGAGPALVPPAVPVDRAQAVQDWMSHAHASSSVPSIGASANEATGILEKLLARQSVPKDLPTFSGDPSDWQLFLRQYEHTTRMCGLSNEENAMRLAKCLKGKAYETVSAMLGVPENVPLVLDTLRMTFGRPDMIIKSMITKAKALPAVLESKPDSIVSLNNSVRSLVATMRALKCTGHMQNPQLIEELVQKLPYSYQMQWCLFVKKLPEYTLNDLSDWLTEMAEAACLMPVTATVESSGSEATEKSKDKKGFGSKKEATLPHKLESKIPGSCVVCKQPGHKVSACTTFLQADTSRRTQLVNDNRLCFACLIPGHMSSKCRNKKECGKDGCKKFHHQLLHKPEVSATIATATDSTFVGHGSGASTVMLKVLPVKLKGPLGTVETFAMIDDGSTVTLIESSLSEKLGLEGQQSPLYMQWTKAICQEEPDSKKVTAQISGVHKKKFFELKNIRTVKDLDLPVQNVDMNDIRAKWPHLRDVNFRSIVNGKPEILIAQNNARLIRGLKTISGGDDDPVATKTLLGWVVHGPTATLPPIERVMFHACPDSADEELNDLVKQSFSLDNFGIKLVDDKSRNAEEERADFLLRTTTERVGERFQTGLLWREDSFKFPDSKQNALSRLWCMERKMKKDEKFAQAYCDKIEDYVTKGYARRLSPEEAAVTGPKTYYIPHFAVFNPNKPGKMRLVFDAAAKSGGISFNDALLTGPDLLKPIPAILWRFRRGKVAFTGDVSEMFHQVLIRPEDQDSQRFLWRGRDQRHDPDVYVMRAMIFGAACSPASAIYVMGRNAEDFESEYPDAVQTIKNNTYMDDTIDSCDDIEEAKRRIAEIIEVDRRGGFKICNWITNSRSVLDSIPVDYRGKGWQNLDPNAALPTERVLGMFWNVEEDCFTFKARFHKVKDEVLSGDKRPTKREILQLMMSLFDPLGLLSHFMVKVRILFQEVWKTGIGWDDTIPDVLEKFWKGWLMELSQVTSVTIPRCYSPFLPSATDVQLHIFNDASTQAYACAAYLRICYDSGVDVVLVAGKARVKPLREISIPRMELQAALMGSRLAATLLRELWLPISTTFFWSDSQTVIFWLKSKKKLPLWESNRVREILSSSRPEQWRWVPTEFNPADAATRSSKKTEFDLACIWFSGPDYLRREESEWPTLSKLPDCEVEATPEVVHFAADEEPECCLPDPTRFDCWLKLIRVTAWILRIIENLKRKRTNELPVVGELRVNELKRAEILWVKHTQATEFALEKEILLQNREKSSDAKESLPKGSRLYNLSVFLDENDVIRLKGRTVLSKELSDDTKFPFALTSKSQYVKLLLDFHHKQMGHQGVDTVIHLVQQKYWITGVRRAVKAIVRDCQFCSNRRAKPCDPEMGMLPPGRVNPAPRPFVHVGLDFFGPLHVKVGKKQEKRYGLIFTCMAVRAVHIEMTESLTTDSTLMAIRRFAARRGYPAEISCDNSTSFQGCQRELRELCSKIDFESIQRSLSAFGIDWYFSPPATPHWGGSWERLIRSVKTALGAILKERYPKQETLVTLLAEAEYMVNSRPLTHVSVDPEDMEAITPMHFLLMGDRRVPSWSDPDPDLRKQYQQAQMLSDMLWTRWVKEYLPTINLRPKWNRPARQIEVGDVVLVVDPNGPRNTWPLGVVERVITGRDGVIRVADVRTNDGIYRRGVRQLVVLDVRK